MSQTTRIKLRTLDDEAKARLRSLLRYGDTGKIAARCSFITYRQITNVLNGSSENDKVWEEVIKFLNELEDVEVDERIAEFVLDEKVEAA